jgi:hypothetical protein
VTAPSWFNVYDSARGRWLQHEYEFGGSDVPFGPHDGAAEFESYEDALAAAEACIATNEEFDGDLIVLGDFGLVEA